MIAERQPVHVPDSRDSSAYRDGRPGTVALVELGGARTFIAVPMLKEGRVVGGIQIYRPEVRPFTQKQIDLVSTFANQAVIAIENVRLFNETKEALEQQTVISEILRVIGSSPTDTQPVFDAIVKSGVHLFDGLNVTLRLVRGDQVERVASTRPAQTGDPLISTFSDDGFPAARAIQRCEVVHIPDVLAEDWISSERKARVERRGFRAIFYAPLLRGNSAIGAISVSRATLGPFSDKQIALLKTFADQAVIAIENVRLFKETKEALEQQKATADVLSVISRSPTDLQPVFDGILENATRLCDAHLGFLNLADGNMYKTVAHHGGNPKFVKWIIERGPFQTDGTLLEKMHAEGRPVQIPDLREGFAYRNKNPNATALVELGKVRTFLAVPMLKDGCVLGGITIYRPEVRPFTQKQIDLLVSFASQAVIAIENARLFNETKEALEQQTVISEILRVISSSPTDTQPVFDAIVKSGVHLFGGMNVSLRLIKGDHAETVASTLPSHEAHGGFAVPLADEGVASGRAIRRGEVVQIPDMLAAEEWVSARSKQRAAERGFRALLIAPMIRDNNAIGSIHVNRATPGPFSDKQVALLRTFADQAVIAIENVRLFNETKEALEQQTVISEILRVISSSPTDTQPVFDAIVKSGVHLFGGMNVTLRLANADQLDSVSSTRSDVEPTVSLQQA